MDEESEDELYKAGFQTWHFAKSTTVAGDLLYHIQNTEPEKDKRRLCKTQLAIKGQTSAHNASCVAPGGPRNCKGKRANNCPPK